MLLNVDNSRCVVISEKCLQTHRGDAVHSSTPMTLNVVDLHRNFCGACNNVNTFVCTSKHCVDRGCVRVMSCEEFVGS